jgi:hypothetical protein
MRPSQTVRASDVSARVFRELQLTHGGNDYREPWTSAAWPRLDPPIEEGCANRRAVVGASVVVSMNSSFLGTNRSCSRTGSLAAPVGYTLDSVAKSKVTKPRIFRENKKREITDSYLPGGQAGG